MHPGQLISGKPIFPGTSTMNQLDRIMEVTGCPSAEDVEAIKSPFAATMLESLPMSRPKPLSDMFPQASVEALDLLRMCLQFNPSKRISANSALRHPYVVEFHKPEEEPECDRVIQIPIDDNKKLSVVDYRERLYGEVLKRKKEQRRTQRRTTEGTPAQPEGRSAQPSSGHSSGYGSHQGSSSYHQSSGGAYPSDARYGHHSSYGHQPSSSQHSTQPAHAAHRSSGGHATQPGHHYSTHSTSQHYGQASHGQYADYGQARSTHSAGASAGSGSGHHYYEASHGQYPSYYSKNGSAVHGAVGGYPKKR